MQMTTPTSVRVVQQKQGDGWVCYHGDVVEVIPGIPDNSIGLSVFSPPFADLYTYSNSERDIGNSGSGNEFWRHFGYVIPQLLRVTMPGRCCCVHCMNLPAIKQWHGHIGIRNFRDDIIRKFIDDEEVDLLQALERLEVRARHAQFVEKNPERTDRIREARTIILGELRRYPPSSKGWIFHSEVCIWKNPVTAMQRTKALGLLHKQVVKDSCMSRMGIPDYVCTFRKPGDNPQPVHGELDHFVGDQSTFQRTGRLSIDIWQRYASPIWMDINPSNTLQFRQARDEKDERHICPLQLDVIERCLQLWSNEGDVVLSPFAGIGSEGYEAVLHGRKFVGVELKESYWKVACGHLRTAETKRREANRKLFE